MTGLEEGEHERDDQEPEPIVGDAPPTARTLFSNKAYDILKWVAQIFLPALGTFYAAVGGLWELPKVHETVGTIVAADLLLGALLGLSARQYNNSEAKYDGALLLDEENDSHDIVLKRSAAPAVEAGQPITLKIEKV